MRKFFSTIFTKILDNQTYFWITLTLTFIITRLTVWFYPINSDHWIFFYVGKIFAQGGTFYVNAWDHKPPMIFVFNGLMSLILGNNLVLHRIFLTLLAILAIYFFYLLARIIIPKLNLQNNEWLIKLSVILFVFWANLSQFTSSGNNTENFGLVFLLLMILAYFWFRDSANRWFLILAGACLSILFFLKGTFLLFVLPIGIEMILSKRGLKNILLDILVFVSPLILHAGIWIWYFAEHNAMYDFLVACFYFSSAYVKSAWAGNVSASKLIFLEIMTPVFVLLLIFGLRFLADFKKGIRQLIYRFLFFWTLTGLAIGSFAGDFYPYYFLIFIPSFVFLLIYWQDIFLSFRPTSRNLEIPDQSRDDQNPTPGVGLVWLKIMIGILGLSMIVSLGMAYKQFYNYFRGSGKAEIAEFQQIADYIKENSDPNDKIFFYSYGATMYHLTNRDSGSRFVSASVLLLDEREHYGFNLSDTFISDMEKSKPNFVILPRDPDDLYYQNGKVSSYLRGNYVPVKYFDTFFVAER